ncbi:high affinity copper uptake protein 1 [Thrips palmi]|uniref:Copper transport protein n=1 Tax=Thrips palmi TaxID=161013 RepID=A0A6P9A8G7_THRPL|nr:high affinity copper uptake protein 1 [Thrips palmi]
MDHSHHSHSDHMEDHSGHHVHADTPMADAAINDHSAHFSMGGHSMTFHFGYQEKILFDCWQTTSPTTLFASCLGIVILSALYEGLKYFREYLFWKSYNNNVQYRAVEIPAGNKNVVRDDQVVTMVGEVITKQPMSMFSRMHALQTLLHIIQLTISYLLMLVFMTFNVWLCLSVVFGAALGYFMFGWKKPVVVDVTEHCH